MREVQADPPKQGWLRRLPEASYIGRVWVHWVMAVQQRRQGWLDSPVHAAVREAILHTTARYRLICPAYTLMPDHFQFLMAGCDAGSHQLRAAAFLRRQLNEILASTGVVLQKQGYDHILREHERGPDALSATMMYILMNPVEEGLCADWRSWPWCGAVVPGYPWFSPKDGDCLDKLHRLWNDLSRE